MMKSELVKRIASQKPHLFERDIEKIVNAILDEMIEALRRGDRVELREFGMFSAKLREARQGRNPKTGAVVAVGKKAVPYFKTGKEMRKRLNRETVPPDSLASLPLSQKERDRPFHGGRSPPYACFRIYPFVTPGGGGGGALPLPYG